MIKIRRVRSVGAIGLTALVLTTGACAADSGSPDPAGSAASSPDASAGATSAAASAAPSPTPTTYRIGLSNTKTDDGWRTEMVCSARAQALTSGRVERLTVADRDTDAAGQTADVANLVATGVDAVILYAVDPDVVDESVVAAMETGLVVVAIDRAVDAEGSYLVATDHEAYGYAGAAWLFETLGGKGKVVYLRGPADDPIDTARDSGFKRALADFPDIKIVSETQTDWDRTVAVREFNAFLATGKDFDGIWTSGGIGAVIVDALKTADAPLVPIVGSDQGSFVSQLLAEEGLVGAAVTDSAAVGGAGVSLALDILDGRPPADPAVLIAPEVWANDTDAGRSRLEEADDPDIDLGWPLSIMIPGRTTYLKEDILACKGPNQ